MAAARTAAVPVVFQEWLLREQLIDKCFPAAFAGGAIVTRGPYLHLLGAVLQQMNEGESTAGQRASGSFGVGSFTSVVCERRLSSFWLICKVAGRQFPNWQVKSVFLLYILTHTHTEDCNWASLQRGPWRHACASLAA